MKDKIICLVGESGSGKTTIAELLELEGYNYIESYTTRPPRFEGERGHVFVDSFPDEDFYICDCIDNSVIPLERVIAYTFFNGNHYWATKEQYQGKGTSIYIIDVPGVKKLKETVTDAEIVVIYLKSNMETRRARMIIERGSQEAEKRIFHDKDKFKLVECDYVIDTDRYVEEVLELVKQVIGGLEDDI